MSKLTKQSQSSAAPLDDEASRIKAAQGKGSYVPDEHERHLYHIKMDRPAFDPSTGERRGAKPFKQKFIIQDWKNHLKYGAQLGYKTEVIWNPEAYAGNETTTAPEASDEGAE